MGKKWTDEEIQFLKFAYPNKDFTVKEISKELNRSAISIRHKANKLGLLLYREPLPHGFKRCTKCKTIFSLEFFYIKRGSRDGHGYLCKECDKEKSRKYYKYKKEIIEEKEIIGEKETTGEKKCPRCKEIKDISMFWKNRSSNDGYHWHCKECTKILKNESNLRLLKERGW